MATTTPEAVKDRIRKLLALANDAGASRGEIDNASRFAARLMTEYQLSSADLDENDPHERAAAEEMGRVYAATLQQGFIAWEGSLARYICELVGGIRYYLVNSAKIEKRTAHGTLEFDEKGRKKLVGQIAFYGEVESVKLAHDLFLELTQTVLAVARMKYGTAFIGEGRSYAAGFVDGLHAQLAKRFEAVDTKQLPAGETNALVAISSEKRAAILKFNADRGARADAWLRDVAGTKLVNKGGGTGFDAGAYRAGHRDGLASTVNAKRTLRLGAAAR